MLPQTIAMAFKAIRTNKVRAALTMLGVIIGVMSVVVLVAIGQGTTASVTDSIQGMGTNLLTVNITTRRVGQYGGYGGGPQGAAPAQPQSAGQQRGTVVLSLSDILGLEASEAIDKISPMVNGSVTVKAGNKNTTVSMMGVLPAYADIRNQSVQSGRYIVQSDVDNRSARCVIGAQTAEDVFGNTNVVGNTLHINGRAFQIVGVLESKGSSAGTSSDEVVILPYTLAQRMLGSTTIGSFYVSAVSAEAVTQAQTYVENYLYKRYQNTSAYRVSNQTEMLNTINETTGQLTLMLGGIAGIALLVGGIGIMNIMLVSVTERTREIGIRKAVGARRVNILLQFLIEAVVLSGLGGLLGLVFGWLLMQALRTMLNMTLIMSLGVVELAIGFSMAVGIVFGLYPAGKASKLRPIEALRYD
ncbi:MAG: ABC transporter permease [Oscillospiraceae bacterium]|jgi:putative ABC transport system permease protein|nr:ABC transporter permease [Oscillospiraceae bacterium]